MPRFEATIKLTGDNVQLTEYHMVKGPKGARRRARKLIITDHARKLILKRVVESFKDSKLTPALDYFTNDAGEICVKVTAG